MIRISENKSEAWSLFRKAVFRFLFIFITSFIFVFNNGTFPLYGYINTPLNDLMHLVTPWFAKTVLRYTYDYSIFVNGSGDTSYAWVSLLLLITFALAASLIWSLTDSKRPHYNTLYYWLTVLIRYYIAFMLINYGVIKVMHAQMPPPTLTRLIQPLGEFSPMGLAWTFIGYSKGYNILIGVAEILSVFLLFRKTMVLGCLITTVSTINIMAINYFYDVPVKMISTALFLLSVYLLIPYLQSLYTLFILGKPVQLTQLGQPLKEDWRKKGIKICKIFIISLFTILQVIGIYKTRQAMSTYFSRSPLYGIYRFAPLQKAVRTIPEDWRLIIFEFNNDHVLVRDSYYSPIYQTVIIDHPKKKITLNQFQYDYKINQNGDILLRKVFDDRVEEIKLIKQDPQQFELLTHPFRWIQEFPHNR